MILRNITLEHDLVFQEDHVHTIVAKSPRLFGRIVQSMVALEAGESPLQPFIWIEEGRELDSSRLLFLVTDPFHIDLNSRKNISALYTRLENLLTADIEKHAKWERLMLQAEDLVQSLTQQINAETFQQYPMAFSGFLKEAGIKFDIPFDAEPMKRILLLFDIISEFSPQRVVVLCNTAAYLGEISWRELMKYACYTKVKLLDIEPALPEKLYEHEIRWTIQEDYDDEILKG